MLNLHVLLSLAFLLPLSACNGSNKSNDSKQADKETTYEHSIVPDAYRGAWDVESVNCEDSIFYWAFEGEIAQDGGISGNESWYWFFNDDGKMGGEEDCVDTFSVVGKEEDTSLDTPCRSCDREFTGTWELGATGCNWDGYEDLLDNDTVDRIKEEKYNLIFLLDAVDANGLLDSMNVWSYVQDDQNTNAYIDRPISVGTYSPTGSDDLGPAGVTWALNTGECVNIK